MNTSKSVISSVDQATAAWMAYLKKCRINELIDQLRQLNIDFKEAMNYLNIAGHEINKIIDTNRGGSKGMHGYIAEVLEVRTENSRSKMNGSPAEAFWVNDNGMTDFTRGNLNLQQKFVNSGGHFSLKAVSEHLKKYPDFLKNGKYQIPKDHYEQIKRLYFMPADEAKKLSLSADGITYKKWKEIQDFFNKENITFNDLEPSLFDYSDVQVNQYDKTLNRERRALKEKYRKAQEKQYKKSQPKLQEGIYVTTISALMEGGTKTILCITKKMQNGKNINNFNNEDWKDVGITFVKGTGKGGLSGAATYSIINNTATAASTASAVVTASFGMAEQAYMLKNNEITEQEFLENCQVLCVESTISALSSFIGQTVIQVPVLGAVIGNAVGNMMYSIASEYLKKREQKIIKKYIDKIHSLDKRLNNEYETALKILGKNMQIYVRALSEVFSVDAKESFDASIALAKNLGVSRDKILKSKKDIDRYYS